MQVVEEAQAGARPHFVRLRTAVLVIAGGVVLLGTWPRTVFRTHCTFPRRGAESQVRIFLQSLREYHAGEGHYPVELEDLTVPGVADEPYLARIPLDPWERPYQYGLSDAGEPLILTLGADGKPGGSGDDADVRSDSLRDD